MPLDLQQWTTMVLAGPYLISLCDAAQNSGFSFGAASRLGTQSSTFSVDAAKLIHSIVTFSPASESVAIEFLQEFQKASGMKHFLSVPLICKHSSLGWRYYRAVEPVVFLLSEFEPQQWAQEILGLRNCETNELDVELNPVRDLATEYLNHLLIASMSLCLAWIVLDSGCPSSKSGGGKNSTSVHTSHPWHRPFTFHPRTVAW
jgi:hypothetical protein